MRSVPAAEFTRRPVEGLDLSPPTVVKYMGSKRSQLPVLAPRLAALCAPDSTIVDLFAGTQVVGCSLRHRNRIIGVDSQRYSAVLGSALLVDDAAGHSAQELVARLAPHLERHQSAVTSLYNRVAATERRLVSTLLSDTCDSRDVDAYAAFQGSLPDPAQWTASTSTPPGSFASKLRDLIDTRRGAPGEFPYLLMTAYYANAYFGIEQAISLDGIRYAIDQEFASGPARNICLAALLSAASNCTSTPGHFAMWRVIRTANGARDIARFRTRDPFTYFARKLGELCERASPPSHNHLFITGDSLAFARAYSGAVGAVYVDPPYSSVHYSRFYHVLEELLDYDYPPVYFTGRFPADRYASPWSVRSQAVEAFADLLGLLSARGWPALISYGTGGLVNEATLVRLCQRAFGNSGVTLERVLTRHASMGRADRGARSARELLVTCRPGRQR